MSHDDGCDVGVLNEGLDVNLARRMNDDDGVRIDASYGKDQLIAIGPEREVVAISVRGN